MFAAWTAELPVRRADRQRARLELHHLPTHTADTTRLIPPAAADRARERHRKPGAQACSTCAQGTPQPKRWHAGKTRQGRSSLWCGARASAHRRRGRGGGGLVGRVGGIPLDRAAVRLHELRPRVLVPVRRVDPGLHIHGGGGHLRPPAAPLGSPCWDLRSPSLESPGVSVLLRSGGSWVSAGWLTGCMAAIWASRCSKADIMKFSCICACPTAAALRRQETGRTRGTRNTASRCGHMHHDADTCRCVG